MSTSIADAKTNDDTNSRPLTILSSRTYAGTSPSTSSHNVSWNQDGQCLFLNRRAVHIVTPHLATCLSAPSNLGPSSTSGPNTNGGSKEDEDEEEVEVDGDVEMDESGPSTSVPNNAAAGGGGGSKSLGYKKLRRPVGDEIRWWVTAVEVDRDGKREEYYGWADVGEESTAIITEREITLRSAIWSPSGLSDLGSCLLVVVTSVMQVSVYAPRSDPYAKQWDEIADLTMLSKALLPEEDTRDGLRERGMTQLRTMCVQWSDSTPLSSMIGVDGSLLAISNRAGHVALWNYGPERQFKRLAVLNLGLKGGWVGDLAWSTWQVMNNDTCEAQLALTATDGSVRLLPVKRKAKRDNSKRQWDLQLGEVETIYRADKRATTAVQWFKDVLLWTKAGTVHLFAREQNETVRWSGTKTVRLDRVGNWAGANGLGPCVGIHLINSETLLVVLSSLTAHLITSFTSSPTLAPPLDSLKVAIALRQTFLDKLYVDPGIKMRWRNLPIEDQSWTAHTQGFTPLGYGGLATWVNEPFSYHNLDAVTEGKRTITFTLADLGNTSPSSDYSLIQSLESIMSNPPNLLHISPGRVLMPYLLHVLASQDPQAYAEEILNLVKAIDLPKSDKNDSSLLESLWGQSKLDALRLKLVLTIWGSSTFISLSEGFKSASSAICKEISRYTSEQLINHIQKSTEGTTLGSIDRQFISHLQSSIDTLTTSDEDRDKEQCPACGTVVGHDGVCERDHVWSRCAITHLLITHPRYRVCSTCPAISLLPTRHGSAPIPVELDGSDKDWQRFIPAESEIAIGQELEKGEDWIVQQVLEGAVCCLLCGGRWMRAV